MRPWRNLYVKEEPCAFRGVPREAYPSMAETRHPNESADDIDAMPEKALRAKAKAMQAVDEVAQALASELDLALLVQRITDAGTKQTAAEFGAFFYNVVNDRGEAYSLYTLAGVPREAFSKFPMPRNTALFDATFRGEGIVRSGDVQKDPRYGKSAPHFGMPKGHLPVRSYLAAPVVSRTGEVLGGLFFGHPEPGRFTEEHERLLAGIARYAAIALDNARLFEKARAGDLANTRLAAIVQSSDDAIVAKDLNGVIQSWNAGAERMFGYSSAEIVGKPVMTLIPPDRPDEEANILARLRRGERVDHFETVRVTKDGRLINVSVTISPIRDSSGSVIGASKVARDITERKRAEAEREMLLAAERRARGEAERHSRMKDEFLATLGHELRTPLNAVLGWATILRGSKNDPAEVEHGLSVIERNARLQAQLIEDLLDMSRVVAGKLRLNVQEVDLSGVIQSAIESVRPAADARDIRLLPVLDAKSGPVSGDPGRLQQIIWNLLSNAVKFTPKGGKVHILMERVDSHIEVSVTDTGQGITEEFLPLVFDRFRQADASTTRQHGGLGLGLAIVKHLVELHGGTVSARSPGLGKGSTFTIILPVRATQKQFLTADPAPIVEDAGPAGISLSGLKVLVVDDDPDARDLVRHVLELAGAKAKLASSSSEAVDALRSELPHVIISDIGMPSEDGFALIRRIRAFPKDEGGTIPAVALTAFARAEDRRRALLSGFQMHVSKPVEPSELLAVVASLTRRV